MRIMSYNRGRGDGLVVRSTSPVFSRWHGLEISAGLHARYAIAIVARQISYASQGR